MPVPDPLNPRDNPLNQFDPWRDWLPSDVPAVPGVGNVTNPLGDNAFADTAAAQAAGWQGLNRAFFHQGRRGGLVEVQGSRSFTYFGNAFKGQRIFQCPWEYKMRWLARLMGYPVLKGYGTTAPYVERQEPSRYEFYADRVPGLDYDDDARDGAKLWATGAEMVEPKGAARRHAATEQSVDTDYLYAHLRMTYESLPYSVKPDGEVKTTGTVGDHAVSNTPLDFGPLGRRFVTRIVQPQIEILRLPFGFYKWAEGIKYSGNVKAAIEEAVATGYFKVLPYSEITYIWHQVPELPKAVWGAYQPTNNVGAAVDESPLVGAAYTHVGCVNKDWFDGCPPESLLLTAVEARMYKWVTGQRLYDYVWKCKYMNPLDEIPSGANVYYKTGGVETNDIARGVGGYKPRQLGHNHFLRYAFPRTTSLADMVEPFYSKMTHNGHRDGKTIYATRDFTELFRPFNRGFLAQKYAL